MDEKQSGSVRNVAFISNRQLPDSLEELNAFVLQVARALRSLVDIGSRVFISDATRGFNTYAALIAMLFKDKYNVELKLILPCEGREKSWSRDDKRRFEALMQYSQSVVYTQRKYTNGCLTFNSRAVVAAADVLLCYIDTGFLGAFDAYAYALRLKKRIVIIN